MTSPTPTAFPPVTQERIASTLEGMDLKYFREDGGEVRTAFPGLVVFFEVEREGFKATSRWMAVVDEPEDVEKLREFANVMNRTLPLVRVHPVQRQDGTAIAIMEAPFFSGDGFADTQLREMCEYFFSAIHHVAGQLRETFPGLEESFNDGAKEA